MTIFVESSVCGVAGGERLGSREKEKGKRRGAESTETRRGRGEEEGTTCRAPTREKANGEDLEIFLSEFSGPLAGGVKNAKDFDGICADSIGNDVGCVANYQLART
jgi:hypothetical protein